MSDNFSIDYSSRDALLQNLRGSPDNSLHFIVLITGAIQEDCLTPYLDECIRTLKDGGLLFVQGTPDKLPDLGVYLDRFLNFKYWIAIESTLYHPSKGFPSTHAGLLLFSKGNGRFNIRRVRFPHEYCAFCGKPLRDWGGKVHLMHPDGYAISDVWKGLPRSDCYNYISQAVLNTIEEMLNFPVPKIHEPTQSKYLLDDVWERKKALRGIIGPDEGVKVTERSVAEPTIQYQLPGLEIYSHSRQIPKTKVSKLWNVVHHGDAVEILRQYPNNSVDLVFADPPYNLDKAYNVYNDEQSDKEYLKWCNTWLEEYVRILKPNGSLYVLNLPHWTMYHAAFLNNRLYLQNWIVWDALSEPRGKLMPAHYGLLFYTKHLTDFIFNLAEIERIDAHYYCLRSSCIRQRTAQGVNDKEPLTDIWWDIHRLKHRRDRDYHPCQLPDTLMERIIRISSNPGDIVLDALAGTGTTAVVANRLGRRYVAIDVDEKYVEITRQKLSEVERLGFIPRKSTRKPKTRYSKKELQLELRDLASRLGRLPTPEDVQKMSCYDLDAFLETFPSWGKALKAAKMEVENGSRP